MAKTYTAEEVKAIKADLQSKIAGVKGELKAAKAAQKESAQAAKALDKEVTRLKKHVTKLEGVKQQAQEKSPLSKTPTSSAGWSRR